MKDVRLIFSVVTAKLLGRLQHGIGDFHIVWLVRSQHLPSKRVDDGLCLGQVLHCIVFDKVRNHVSIRCDLSKPRVAFVHKFAGHIKFYSCLLGVRRLDVAYIVATNHLVRLCAKERLVLVVLASH